MKPSAAVWRGPVDLNFVLISKNKNDKKIHWLFGRLLDDKVVSLSVCFPPVSKRRRYISFLDIFQSDRADLIAISLNAPIFSLLCCLR